MDVTSFVVFIFAVTDFNLSVVTCIAIIKTFELVLELSLYFFYAWETHSP